MTRKQLKAISTIQTLIGRAESFHGNDRDRDGFEKGQNALREASGRAKGAHPGAGGQEAGKIIIQTAPFPLASHCHLVA